MHACVMHAHSAPRCLVLARVAHSAINDLLLVSVFMVEIGNGLIRGQP